MAYSLAMTTKQRAARLRQIARIAQRLYGKPSTAIVVEEAAQALSDADLAPVPAIEDEDTLWRAVPAAIEQHADLC